MAAHAGRNRLRSPAVHSAIPRVHAGTRPSSVTVAACVLQKAALIQYRRALVRILDRKGLEAATGEWYEAWQQQASKWKADSH
jgi:hypothetical protein